MFWLFLLYLWWWCYQTPSEGWGRGANLPKLVLHIIPLMLEVKQGNCEFSFNFFYYSNGLEMTGPILIQKILLS